MYKDESDFLMNSSQAGDTDPTCSTKEENKPSLFEDSLIPKAQLADEMNIDDEDEWLYGCSKTDLPFFKVRTIYFSFKLNLKF